MTDGVVSGKLVLNHSGQIYSKSQILIAVSLVLWCSNFSVKYFIIFFVFEFTFLQFSMRLLQKFKGFNLIFLISGV